MPYVEMLNDKDFLVPVGTTPKEIFLRVWEEGLQELVVPEDLSAQEYLKILCFNGLNRKYPGFTPLLESRLDKEIEILYAVGFIEGFLIVHDLIDHARSNNILISPGRGALPGSLAAYCLGITGVDPIKFDLLFEHYVNKESAAYINEPYMKHFNIWIDVELGGKQRITDHIIEKYGPGMPKLLELVEIRFSDWRDLSIVKDTACKIFENTGKVINIASIDQNDPYVFSYLLSNDTDGILLFDDINPHDYTAYGWFDEHGMWHEEHIQMVVENRDLLSAMHPGNMEELIAFFSWDRPGIPDNIINCYLQNKSDPSQIVYEIPELEPILKETYGCLIYQEQIDRIVHEIGGFTLDKSESVRRDVAKRKQSGLRETRESFIKGNKEEKIPGCVSKGISEDTANTIFDRIYDQAPYCFNKAHAAAIAFMAYSMAWLKYHYRGEYAEVIRDYKRREG